MPRPRHGLAEAGRVAACALTSACAQAQTPMNFLAESAQALADNDMAVMAAVLMRSRQTILPKRLAEPGPDRQQLGLILGAAATAPDHGQLLPWRFVRVPQAARAPGRGVWRGTGQARRRHA